MTALTVFGTRAKDAIFLPQVPFAVRNDCQAGQWKVGEDDFRGNQIEISIIKIIKVAQFFGTLGKTKNNLWMQLWFVPAPECINLPANTVCMTYIKSRSISQFSQKVTELMESGEPAEGIFIGSFEKHSGEYGTYYSVTWNWRERKNADEKQQLEQIAGFLETGPHLVDMSTYLIPIDGMSAEEIELLVRSARSQEINVEPAQKTSALAVK